MTRALLVVSITLALLWTLAFLLSPAPLPAAQVPNATLTRQGLMPLVYGRGESGVIPTPSGTPTRTILTPPSPPTLAVTPPGLNTPGGIPGTNVNCITVGSNEVCASVSVARPAAGVPVTVYGRLRIGGISQVGAQMSVSTPAAVTPAACAAAAAGNGIAQCQLGSAGVPANTAVLVKVTMGGLSVFTAFEPQ